MKGRISASLLALWICALAAGASERVNPFAPQLPEPEVAARPHSAAVVPVTKHPRLRGVLHSTLGSMANLDGHVLSERESVLGYQLLAVQEHSADFVFRGQRLRLYVTTDQEAGSQ